MDLTIQIFGDRVIDHICSKIKWSDKVRGHESIVHNHLHPLQNDKKQYKSCQQPSNQDLIKLGLGLGALEVHIHTQDCQSFRKGSPTSGLDRLQLTNYTFLCLAILTTASRSVYLNSGFVKDSTHNIYTEQKSTHYNYFPYQSQHNYYSIMHNLLQSASLYSHVTTKLMVM